MAKIHDQPKKEKIPTTPRAQLLTEALSITTKDRNAAYGSPENNFQNIADRWNLYLKAQGIDIELNPTDVAYMMIDMKMARLSTNPTHYDSILDVAGYAACAADCVAAEQIKTRAGISGNLA